MKKDKMGKHDIKAVRFYRGIAKEHLYEMDISHFSWLLIKFLIYGSIGLIMEITFSNLVRILSLIPIAGDIVKNFTQMIFPPGIPNHFLFPWKVMYAMTSLWMVFVYGSGLYAIEWLYTLLKPRKVNIFIRAIFYSIAILIVEFVWGWLYRLILGEFVWEYRSFLVTTTLGIIPFWYFGSFIGEMICKKMNEKDMEIAFRTNYDIPLPVFEEKEEN